MICCFLELWNFFYDEIRYNLVHISVFVYGWYNNLHSMKSPWTLVKDKISLGFCNVRKIVNEYLYFRKNLKKRCRDWILQLSKSQTMCTRAHLPFVPCWNNRWRLTWESQTIITSWLLWIQTQNHHNNYIMTGTGNPKDYFTRLDEFEICSGILSDMWHCLELHFCL